MKRSTLLAAVTSLLLATAACGGDDEDGSGVDVDVTVPSELTLPDDVTLPDTIPDLDDVTLPGSLPDLDDVTLPDSLPDLDEVTIPGLDVTIPEDLTDITLPEGMSEECTDLYSQFSTMLGSMMSGAENAGEEADAAIEALRSEVPEDLQDDVDVLAEAYGEMSAILEEYGGDMTQAMSDPELLERLEALQSGGAQEAADNIQAYFEETCAVG